MERLDVEVYDPEFVDRKDPKEYEDGRTYNLKSCQIQPAIIRALHRYGLTISGNTHVMIIPSEKPGEKLLNLGCGNDYVEGYVNIDISRTVKTDLCIDFKLVNSFFEPESVSGIVMHHSFPYMNLWEQAQFIKDVRGILGKNGMLVLQHPDVEIIYRESERRKGDVDFYLEAARGLYAFDTNDIIHKQKPIPYAFGWANWALAKLLCSAGFHAGYIDLRIEPVVQGWRDSVVFGVRA